MSLLRGRGVWGSSGGAGRRGGGGPGGGARGTDAPGQRQRAELKNGINSEFKCDENSRMVGIALQHNTPITHHVF